MSSFAVPFFGNITSLTVDPATNHLWVSTTHPNDRSIHPVSIDVSSLLKTKQVNSNVDTVSVDGKVTSVFGHHTGMYLATESGQVLRDSEGTQVECINVGSEFDLQAIVGFRDGGLEYPKSNPSADTGLQFVGSSNRNCYWWVDQLPRLLKYPTPGCLPKWLLWIPHMDLVVRSRLGMLKPYFQPMAIHIIVLLDWIRGLYPSITQRMTAIFSTVDVDVEAEVPFANNQGLHVCPLQAFTCPRNRSLRHY